MFDTIIDSAVDRFRPHALTLRDQCNMFASNIIERLDRIASAVESDNTVFVRKYPVVTLQSDGKGYAVFEIPTHEEWTLENMFVRVNATPATVRLFDGPVIDATTDLPVAVIDANGPTPYGHAGGEGVVFQAGRTIYVASFATGQMRMQIRAKRTVATRDNIGAGIRNPTPDRTDNVGEIDSTVQRHVGTWHPGLGRNAA